jgi:hypothetical protein
MENKFQVKVPIWQVSRVTFDNNKDISQIIQFLFIYVRFIQAKESFFAMDDVTLPLVGMLYLVY